MERLLVENYPIPAMGRFGVATLAICVAASAALFLLIRLIITFAYFPVTWVCNLLALLFPSNIDHNHASLYMGVEFGMD